MTNKIYNSVVTNRHNNIEVIYIYSNNMQQYTNIPELYWSKIFFKNIIFIIFNI